MLNPMPKEILPNFLAQYQMDFLNLFVPTVPFTACECTLQDHHVLMITGAPGSGKTMIAQQLMVKLWDVNKCYPFRVTKPSEYSKNCNPEISQAFHIDDVFGSSNFVQGKYDDWVSVFGNMKDDLRSKNTFIIFTCRDNILNANLTDLNNYEVFRNIINISDEQFKLTVVNKCDIFDNHARANQLEIAYKDIVDPNELTEVSEETNCIMQEPMGYPQRVRLLCLMKDVTQEARLRYFRRPMEFLSNIIASYRENDHLSYCILILLLMNDGKLSISFFHHSNRSSEQLLKCMDICRLPSATTMGDLYATAKTLCGSFLILNEDCFVTQHESIMEAATLDFGQNFPADILDRCSIQFLLERVFTKDSTPPDNQYVVILPEVLLPQLCARLIKEIQVCLGVRPTNLVIQLYHWIRGDASSSESDPVTLRSISVYRVFRDPYLVRLFLHRLQHSNSFNPLVTSSSLCIIYPAYLFLAALSGQDTIVHNVIFSYLRDLQSMSQSNSFRLLLRSSSTRSADPFFLFFAALSGQDALIREILSSHLRDVQQLPGFTDHLDQILYAACYGGSSETVRAVLAAGARANYRTAHAPINVKRGWWDKPQTCTTLMHAAWSGNVEVLQLVISHLQQQRVDVVEHAGIRDGWGHTALHWWARGGRGVDVLQILLKAEVSINARNDESLTALYWSARWGDEDDVRALLQAGADVDMRRNDSHTELVEMRDGRPCIVKANPDENDDLGRTALHGSAQTGDEAIVRLLVTAGADVHLRASTPSWYNEVPRYLHYTNKTPLEVAVLCKHTAVADVLRSLPSE